MRMIASEARVNLMDLRSGLIADHAWPRIIEKAARLAETNLYIDDSSMQSPIDIRAKARRLKASKGLDMIIIDYMQMMKMRGKTENRAQEVSEISRLLKSIARELKVPVIALAQLNRQSEGRTDHRPMLSDLRESGSIEQDADVIAMLYRDDYYDRENPEIKGITEVIVGKQRNGPVGTVKLRFETVYGKFTNIEANSAPEHPLPPSPQQQQPNYQKYTKKPSQFA